MFRGSVVAAGHITGYDWTKKFLKRAGLVCEEEEDARLHLAASFVAAVAQTTLATPLDNVCSRYMSAPSRGKAANASVAECAGQIWREAGLGGFYRGWLPFTARVAPMVIVSMPLYELIRKGFGLGYLN
jgi:hypothetical protein